MTFRRVLNSVLIISGGFMVVFLIVTQLIQIHRLEKPNIELRFHNRAHEKDLRDIHASMKIRNQLLRLIAEKVGVPKKDVEATLKNE